MPSIHFFSEDIDFILENQKDTIRWIKKVIKSEKYSLDEITYIFCSDSYLHQINLEYLNHDTLTDIITFDNSEAGESINADIYISIDRVRENSIKFKTVFLDELHRVLVHGVLHLMGHSDKSSGEKVQMRKAEDSYLSLR